MDSILVVISPGTVRAHLLGASARARYPMKKQQRALNPGTPTIHDTKRISGYILYGSCQPGIAAASCGGTLNCFSARGFITSLQSAFLAMLKHAKLDEADLSRMQRCAVVVVVVVMRELTTHHRPTAMRRRAFAGTGVG